jgi:hypothetical protein
MFWVYVVMHADGISPVLISSNMRVRVDSRYGGIDD